MSNGLLESFLGALQASISILLVIFYGVLANQFQLLDAPSAKKISKVCVRFFLPALLVTKLGSELHADTASRYVPILSMWAPSLSFWWLSSDSTCSLGCLLFPRLRRHWFTCRQALQVSHVGDPCIAFNNTTSLPLLLIDSLESTGVLDRLLRNGDTTKKAISRAQAYFHCQKLFHLCHRPTSH